MRLYQKAIIGIAVTLLLTVAAVYLLIPDYDTPEARKAYLTRDNHNYEILSEEVFGDYVICLSRNGAGNGYTLFKDTLGKSRFEHANHSNTGGAKGYLEQDGQTYLIHANFQPNAKSFDIVYYDLESSEEVHRERISIDSDITITPLWDEDGVWNELIFYDMEGNRI